MAAYDNDWRRRRGREGQSWASRRGHDHSGEQGSGYGAEYRGKGHPRGTGYRAGSEGYFGASRYGTGYDFGYQGGEYGRPVNAHGFGTRGPYGTPPRGRGPAGPGFRAGGDVGYGGDYSWSWRGSSGAYDRWRGGRELGGGAEYRPGGYGGGASRWRGGYGRDFGGSRQGFPSGSGDGRPYDRDFGGRPNRYYGRTPPDRWRDRGGYDRPMSDDDVIESVRENLFQDSFVHADRIEVDVDDGVVTLRGEVDDFLEARYAWDDAWESPGVRGVINNLTVRTDRASDEMNMPQTEGSHMRGRRS